MIVAAYVFEGPLKKWQTNLGKPDNFLAKINLDKIEKIEINNNGEISTLLKDGDRWKVDGTKDFFVSQEAKNNLENNLRELSSAGIELISTNKEKKKEFNTNENGVSVKITQDGEEIDFIIGKPGSDYQSTYISRSDLANTYSVKINLLGLAGNMDWRDKTIFSSDKEKISKVRFQHPSREFSIEKIGDNWEGTKPYKFGVSKEKIQKILNLMSNLKAVSIPEQNFAGTDLEKNLIIVQVSGDGVDNTIMIGRNNGEGLYYAKKGNSDNIYLITEEQRNELDKQIWQLR